MSATDLVMYRGDTRSFQLTMAEDGAPLDLTGATLRFTGKRKIGDDDADAVVSVATGSGIVVTDAVNGEIRVTIPSDQTEALTKETVLLWDVQIVFLDGSVRTIPEPVVGDESTLGTLTIKLDVTRTAP